MINTHNVFIVSTPHSASTYTPTSRSARIGRQEDQEDMRREEEENARKRKKMRR